MVGGFPFFLPNFFKCNHIFLVRRSFKSRAQMKKKFFFFLSYFYSFGEAFFVAIIEEFCFFLKTLNASKENFSARGKNKNQVG